MDLSSLMFYLLAFMAVFFGYFTIAVANPIFSALNLALTMITLAGIFFLLDAYFIAGVQLAVYAGAVMVLFVMVLMLFDLSGEVRAFSRGLMSGIVKVGSALLVMLLILLSVLGYYGERLEIGAPPSTAEVVQPTTQDLAILLFSRYLFAFELLGLLLLVVAVGVVAVSRIKGGTHARD